LASAAQGLAIVTLVAGLGRLQAIEGTVIAQDLSGQLGQRALLVGEGEIHSVVLLGESKLRRPPPEET
jgi:hypothetical protein